MVFPMYPIVSCHAEYVRAIDLLWTQKCCLRSVWCGVVCQVHRNKQVHDTFLRSGVMEAMVTDGDGVWQTFDRAVQQLEHKLKENRFAQLHVSWSVL